MARQYNRSNPMMPEKRKKIAPQGRKGHPGQIILLLSLFLAACIPSSVGMVTEKSQVTGSGQAIESNWLGIIFTDPQAPHAASYEGGPDKALAAAIDQARLCVDMAAYSLNLWSIRDALIHAHQRGVMVRMVMESDNMDTQEVQQVLEVGIPIVSDQHESLMHDKFVVIDHAEVWTGSMNFTTSGAYQDDNDLIHIRSTKVAADYTDEFNEMFVEHLFGANSSKKVPFPSVMIDGIRVEVAFSPEDEIAKRFLALITDAQESIFFMAYSFTSDEIGEAIRQRAADGLTVRGVMDGGQINSNTGSEYELLVQAGVDVRKDESAGLMHYKAIIIDRSIVITGSYNFTASAEERNDENVVILHSGEAAAKYLQEFQKIYDQANP
jgi:phosphatidylserine/phosphatidylglycerophosphate/cardiolipin synthase-like enzyme